MLLPMTMPAGASTTSTALVSPLDPNTAAVFSSSSFDGALTVTGPAILLPAKKPSKKTKTKKR